MSTTPRTDAARGFHDMDTAVSAEDMAQLETELAAAKLEADGEARWALEYLARAEKAEAECLEQARLLGMSGEREADLLGKISRLHSIIERASVQFFHEGTDGETAVKMLTILAKAKHELNAGVNKQDL